MDAVGFQRTVVAWTSFERLEPITVIAAQTVPSCQPYIALAVLSDMGYDGFGETVCIIEMLNFDSLPSLAEEWRDNLQLLVSLSFKVSCYKST